MKIICPYCGEDFEWEPTDDTPVVRRKGKKRYIVECPSCKRTFSVTV